MAIQNITNVAKDIANAQTSINDITPELLKSISTLIIIFQAAGVILLLYIGYLIFSGIVSWKNNRRIKEIHTKIEIIEKKIDNIEKAVQKKK
jgi:hypothetical protein